MTGQTTTTVFPVGQGAGRFVPMEHAEPHHHFVVRVGRTSERLSEAEFRTWQLAHRPEQGAAAFSPYEKKGPRDPRIHQAELVARGLLVEVTDPVAFAHRYRLTSQFVGLGNSPDDLDRFGIGVPGLEPMTTVSSAVFELWQWGWIAPSLWAHCEVLATIGEQEGREQSTPEAHLDFVLGALPVLLAGFVAFLEPVSL